MRLFASGIISGEIVKSFLSLPALSDNNISTDNINHGAGV